jgi:hypothetical protein
MTEHESEQVGYDVRLKLLITRLKDMGARVQLKRRKLAHREKDYLKIRAGGNHNTYMSLVKPIIEHWFPDAYMTSGGFGPAWPHASDPYMDITIALVE